MTAASNQLVAGRELDALVAEKVFGWTQIRTTPAGMLWGCNPALVGLQTDYDRRHEMKQRPSMVPRFSTSLDAVVTPVLALAPCFGWLELKIADRQDVNGERSWAAELNGFGTCEAPTPAAAICLAALKAVEASA